jgi:hypothetical protein
MLEVLVHLDREEKPEDYVLMGIDLRRTPIDDASFQNARQISKASVIQFCGSIP